MEMELFYFGSFHLKFSNTWERRIARCYFFKQHRKILEFSVPLVPGALYSLAPNVYVCCTKVSKLAQHD